MREGGPVLEHHRRFGRPGGSARLRRWAPRYLGGTGAAALAGRGVSCWPATKRAERRGLGADRPGEAAATPSCPECFTGFGPVGPARFYEVVKLNDPAYHPPRSDPGGPVSVSHAIDPQAA